MHTISYYIMLGFLFSFPPLVLDRWQRVRNKVGKKVKAAGNTTDTTFKARKIALPTQSLGSTVGLDRIDCVQKKKKKKKMND